MVCALNGTTTITNGVWTQWHTHNNKWRVHSMAHPQSQMVCALNGTPTITNGVCTQWHTHNNKWLVHSMAHPQSQMVCALNGTPTITNGVCVQWHTHNHKWCVHSMAHPVTNGVCTQWHTHNNKWCVHSMTHPQSQMVCALNGTPTITHGVCTQSCPSSQTEAARSQLSQTLVYMKKKAFHAVVIGTPRHWPVELCRYPLVAGGVERSALNILEKSLFFVHVRSAFGVGGKTPTPESD